MTAHATGTYSIKTWVDTPLDEGEDGAGITRSSVTQQFQGDIEGNGAVEFLMVSPDGVSASFVGLQRVVGSVGGRSGSFVLQVSGKFDEEPRGIWSVLPGSGKGDLQGLSGMGGFEARDGGMHFTLDYGFE